MPQPSLRGVVDVIETLYPPVLAAPWDRVGLVCSDPADRVRKVLFAIDPVEDVVEEAVRLGVDLLVTHHPLFLHGTSTVAATSAKGRVVHRLIKAGIALYVAHTNADHAHPGVSDALAAALGVTALHPLDALPAPALDKVVTFVPEADVEKVLDALAAAGAGEVGDYARCAWTSSGVGTFLPGPGARPTLGTVGEVERIAETRIEMVLSRARRFDVVTALRAAHPYEEPAFDIFELARWPGETGTGRVGVLDSAMSLRDFAVHVGLVLPVTAGGGRVAGDLDREVQRVAVCGGSGGDYLAAATAAGADVFVTSDLRHHVVSEHLGDGGCAVIDMPHWATEWPWLSDAAARLRAGLGARGTTVDVEVSAVVTDPWSAYIRPGKETR